MTIFECGVLWVSDVRRRLARSWPGRDDFSATSLARDRFDSRGSWFVAIWIVDLSGY